MMDTPFRLIERCLPPCLSLCSSYRNKFLAFIEDAVPTPIYLGLLFPYFTHIVAVPVAILLMVAVLMTTQTFSIFSFHPIFMALGCVVFMSEGFLVYRNGTLVSTFSPIMGGTSKSQARSIHSTMQMCSVVFSGLGLIFILANKVRLGKSLFPATIHAWIGTLALMLMIIQGLVGMSKIQSPSPLYRWHGNAGKLTFDLSMFAVISGSASFLPVGFLSAFIVTALFALWLSSELQFTISEQKHGK